MGPLPSSGCSSPAMIRSSVVLPEPTGPSSATSSPSGIVEADVAQRRGTRRSVLLMFWTVDAHRLPLPVSAQRLAGAAAASAIRRTLFAASVTSASSASSEATANAATKLYSL